MSSILAFSRTSAMSSSRIRPATTGSLRRSVDGSRADTTGAPGYGPPMSTSTPGQSGHTVSDDPTLGALVHDLSQQIPDLIRSELRLAQAEVAEKGKRAGLGIGMFSAAGLLAFFGVAALLTTVVLALDLVMPAWLAALLVTLVLLAGAAVVGLVGKRQVQQATPAMPERAVEGVKEDIATIKGQGT